MLEADRTYMRDDYALEGWFLVNFVSLLIYYEIYNLLREHDLLSKYSPMDALVHMSRIQKLKMRNKWVTSEIPKRQELYMRSWSNILLKKKSTRDQKLNRKTGMKSLFQSQATFRLK